VEKMNQARVEIWFSETNIWSREFTIEEAKEIMARVGRAMEVKKPVKVTSTTDESFMVINSDKIMFIQMFFVKDKK